MRTSLTGTLAAVRAGGVRAREGARRLMAGVRTGVRLLAPAERRRALWLAGGMLAASALEIVAVAALLPFINIVIQPATVETNAALRRLYQWSGTSTVYEFVFLVGAGVMAAMLVSGVATWLLLYAQNRYVAACQTRLGTELLERCLRAPYPWFLSRNSTMLTRLVYDDVVLWSRGFVQRLIMMAKDALVVVLAVILVLALSPRTGVAVVAAVGLLGIAFAAATRPRLGRLATAKREALGAAMLTAQQALAGIKDVKLSSREGHFGAMFRGVYATVAETHAGLNVWQETPSQILRLLAQMTLVTLALAFWRMGIGSGQIATQLALLLIVTTKVIPAVSALAVAASNLFNALPHIDAIHEALASIESETARVATKTGTGRTPGDWQRIRFDGVSYRYPGAADWALRDLSIELKRTGSYGLVGRSAAGKSTLVDLLVRLLEPTAGRLWIDAQPMETLDAADWQRRIGYVPQMPFISDDTLRANVAFGVHGPSVDDRRVLECLRMANVAELAVELEHGLDTRLGERGSRLSGGQRQRVAIARALYNRPQILVLDEATSALDSLSEAEVQAALKNLADEVMVVTIAHRVSTVSPCTEIFVLDEGRLVGQGSFAELMSQHGLFRRIAEVSA